MLVTARIDSLRSQVAEETTLPANPTTSIQVSKSMIISKTIRKRRSQRKQKQLKAQPPTTSTESETCPIVQQQLLVSEIESRVENNHHLDHEDNRLVNQPLLHHRCKADTKTTAVPTTLSIVAILSTISLTFTTLCSTEQQENSYDIGNDNAD